MLKGGNQRGGKGASITGEGCWWGKWKRSSARGEEGSRRAGPGWLQGRLEFLTWMKWSQGTILSRERCVLWCLQGRLPGDRGGAGEQGRGCCESPVGDNAGQKPGWDHRGGRCVWVLDLWRRSWQICWWIKCGRWDRKEESRMTQRF